MFSPVLKKWKSSSDIQKDLSRDLRFLGKAAATSRSFLELFCACQEGEEVRKRGDPSRNLSLLLNTMFQQPFMDCSSSSSGLSAQPGNLIISVQI